MNSKTYCAVSGAVFAVVALAHLVRAFEQWPVAIAGWNLPLEISWLAVIGAGALSAWAFAARRRAWAAAMLSA